MPGGSPAIGLDTSMVRLETVHLVEAVERVLFAHAHNEGLQVNLVFRKSVLRRLGHACGQLVGEEHEFPRGGSIESNANFLLYRGVLEIREPEGAQPNRPIIVKVVGSLKTFGVHINGLVQERVDRPVVLVD